MKNVSDKYVFRSSNVAMSTSLQMSRDKAVADAQRDLLAQVDAYIVESFSYRNYMRDDKFEEKIDKIKELVNNRSTRLEVYHKLITTGSANADGVAGKLMADAIKAGAIGAGFIPIVKQTAGQMLKKFAGSILPGVQILLGLWTARDLLTMWTGPAFRVTTPCAILISVLREEQFQVNRV